MTIGSEDFVMPYAISRLGSLLSLYNHRKATNLMG